MQRTLLGVTAWIALAALATGHPAAAELKPGDDAPGFKLVGTDGKTYELGKILKRQPVVLAWFPKAFTSGCTLECKSFREFGEKLRAFDVAYFTVSCDKPEDNKKFARSLKLDFPILSDPDRKVARAYGVVDKQHPLAQRWTFYISRKGKLLAIDKRVKVATHASDVAKNLEKLGIPKKKPAPPPQGSRPG
jgi:peroxiredoxin Q/BCP